MRDIESEEGRDEERDQIDISGESQAPARKRGGDRRGDGGLFGSYQGPERRSGRDRRADQAR
jgi:hypothetical protein